MHENPVKTCLSGFAKTNIPDEPIVASSKF
jgi:hypothetical protein